MRLPFDGWILTIDVVVVTMDGFIGVFRLFSYR